MPALARGQLLTGAIRRPHAAKRWRDRWRVARRARSVSAPRRRRLAEDVERLVGRSTVSKGSLTAAVPIHLDASGDARCVLLDLAERLRGPRPVTAHGVALVRTLLCDGCGPLYVPSGPGELRKAAATALSALDGGGAPH